MTESKKSNWFGNEEQKGNFSNDRRDTFDPEKRYIGIRLQQGVPLLDRDWNELEDIRRNEERMLRKWYIGDGVPGDDGFKILALEKEKQGDDFKIKNGRCMVDGFLVINKTDEGFILYSAQTEGEPDAEKISELTEFFVYLDVWIEEVNGEGDPALKNKNDVNMETCVRHQLKWRVRVRSGDLASKAQVHHHYYDLARIERGQTGSIKEEYITDLRRTGLSLSRLREGLFVDKSGKVGIGTDKPYRPLHVVGHEIHSGGAGAGFSFADRGKDFVETPSKGERWVWYANGGIARLWSGEDKLSIKPDGAVGIGTSIPGAKLQIIHIPQDANGNTLILGPIDAANLRLGYHKDYSWIQSHGRKPLCVNPVGNNVGIGTATPSRALHVEDEVHSGGSRGGFSFADKTTKVFVEAPTKGERWVWHAVDGIAHLWSGGNKLSIKPDGAVGIGTATPSRALHVEDEVHSGGIRGGFSFADRNTKVFVEAPTKGERWVLHAVGGTAHLWSGGNKLSIKADGNVGIGTDAPQAKLDVRGDIALGMTAGGGQKLFLTNATYTHFIRANSWWTEFVSHPNEGWKFVSKDNVNEIERVRITSSGNVGIGTDKPSRPLHVVGNEIHSGGSGAGFSFADRGKELVDGPAKGERWVLYSKDGVARLWSGGDKLSVTYDGNVGIGTISPVGKVQIINAPQDANGNTLILGPTTASNLRLGYHDNYSWIQSHGSKPLFINPIGNEVFINGLKSSSDERLKTKIDSIKGALSKLEKIRGISFEWNGSSELFCNSNGRREIGLIAQEVETVFPELVATWGEENYKALDYSRFVAVLVEAIKELKTEVDALKRKVGVAEQDNFIRSDRMVDT